MAEKIHRIDKFQGLHDYADSSGNEGYTRDMKNVYVRYNRVFGRHGMTNLEVATDASDTPIRHLAPYFSNYMRITPNRVEKMAVGAGAWSNITGAATLSGTATMIPQSVTHKEYFVFTNTVVQPYKWSGSGNISAVGGTPPYCKSLAQNWGFLFLFYTSSDGITWDEYEGVYSDDFDVDWSGCGGNELRFDETPGFLVTGDDLGDNVMVYKTDDIIRVRFIGGQLRFSQKRLRYSQGIGAKASLAKIGVIGHAMLNGSFQLVFCDGEIVKELPAKFQHHLDRVMYQPFAYQAFGIGSARNSTYNLFYPTSASDTYNRGRLIVNIETGEFQDLTYDGHHFDHGIYFQDTNDITRQKLLVADNTDVYILDDETATTDMTTPISRYYTTDWTDCKEPGDKYLTGVGLRFRRKVGTRVSVSVAVDGGVRYFSRKTFNLNGPTINGDFTKLLYRPETPLLGDEFKVKVEFHHDRTSVFTELIPPVDILFEPTGVYMLKGDMANVTTVS